MRQTTRLSEFDRGLQAAASSSPMLGILSLMKIHGKFWLCYFCRVRQARCWSLLGCCQRGIHVELLPIHFFAIRQFVNLVIASEDFLGVLGVLVVTSKEVIIDRV